MGEGLKLGALGGPHTFNAQAAKAMLQRYPQSKAARFRHYEWRGPAFTFGLSQSLEFVRAQLPAGEHFRTIETARFAEVLRGVSFTPGTGESADGFDDGPSSGRYFGGR